MHCPILTWWLAICFVLVFTGSDCKLTSGKESLMTLREQTRKLLTSEATTTGSEAKRSAAHALCDLYVVLRSDPRYGQSQMLRGDAAQVRNRLMRISQRTKSKLKRAQAERPKDIEQRVDNILADIQSQDSSSQREPGLDARGGAALADDGWSLIELIQRVIAPDFWEPQGGPGVIRYFAIKRALVVRATTDVHEQLRELITALR